MMKRMIEFDEKYALTGKFIVAMPQINDGGIFDHALIYICSHTSHGTMGLVVNKRLEQFSFSDLTFQLPVADYRKLNEISLYSGGPLEQVRGMVLHSTDYSKEGTILVGKGIAVSSTSEIIADIAFDQGPKEKLIALGYSYWQPRQLEAEIYRNDWMVIDADKELLFQTQDERKWQNAMDITGIDFESFVAVTGHS